VVNRKEPEPQFVISAPAPGGNLIFAPRLRLPTTARYLVQQNGMQIVTVSVPISILNNTKGMHLEAIQINNSYKLVHMYEFANPDPNLLEV
jgi:hypothetical protein